MIDKLLKRQRNYFKSMKPKKMVNTLFASYVVLIIVPILFLGSLFIIISSHQHMEQAQKIRASVLENTSDVLSGKLGDIYTVAYNLMCDDNVLEMGDIYVNRSEKMFALSNVKTSLQRTIAQAELIREIYLYYNDIDITVGTMGKATNAYTMFDMERDEFNAFIEFNNGKFIAINSSDNKKSRFVYIKSIDKIRKSGNVFSICILNNDLITKIIDNVNLDGAGSVMILDDAFNNILEVGNEHLDDGVLTEEFFANMPAGRYTTEEINKEQMSFMLKEVPSTNLRIFSMVNNSYYESKYSYIWIVTLAICFFIIAVGIWVAKIYSKRVYKPITNIIELFKPDNSEKLEKSELIFIENKFIEMNEMNSALLEYKDTYSTYLKELFLCNFVKGHIRDSQDFRKRLNEFNIRLTTDRYTILLIKIDKIEEQLKNIQLYHFQSYVKDSVAAAFEKYCANEYEEIHEFYDDEYIGLIICHDTEIELRQCLEKVQQEVVKELDVSVSVFVSEPMIVWEQIPKEYEKLYSFMMQNKLRGYGALRFADNEPTEGKPTDFKLYDGKIHAFVQSGDYKNLDDIIDEIFGREEMLYNETLQMFNNFVITLVNIINSNGHSANDILKSIKPYTDIEKFGTIEELREYLKRICRMIGDSIKDSDRDKSRMLNKITGYFEANYMHQITLETIAKDFGFSTGYFSRYFKEVTGKKYVEMLTLFRIEKAKEFIRNNKKEKLFEVSEKVGFVRYRTFSEVFKKYTGQTPENFRKSVWKEEL